MSESVSNDGESYSGNSGKYGRSSGSSSESPSGGESMSSNWRATTPPANNEDKINEIKKLLKEAERFLIKHTKQNFPQVDADMVKNKFRKLVLDNESSVINYPTPNTLVDCYEKIYNNLPEKEKQDPENNFLVEGLNAFALSKRQANSKLKYW